MTNVSMYKENVGMAGTIAGENGRTIAYFAEYDGPFHVGGLHSNVTGLNVLGVVVGPSSTRPDPTDPEERAFRWTRESGMESLGSPSRSWSRALAVNDGGTVLCMSASRGTRSYIWTREEGFQDLGSLGGYSTTAIAFNNADVVVGVGEDRQRETQPFLWDRKRGLRPLRLEQKGSPVDLDDAGNILFNYDTDWGTRSFVVAADGRLIYLPWFDYHLCQAQKLRGKLVLGTKHREGNHSHPVYWVVPQL